MNALEVTCPECGATPGQCCKVTFGEGGIAEPDYSNVRFGVNCGHWKRYEACAVFETSNAKSSSDTLTQSITSVQAKEIAESLLTGKPTDNLDVPFSYVMLARDLARYVLRQLAPGKKSYTPPTLTRISAEDPRVKEVAGEVGKELK